MAKATKTKSNDNNQQAYDKLNAQVTSIVAAYEEQVNSLMALDNITKAEQQLIDAKHRFDADITAVKQDLKGMDNVLTKSMYDAWWHRITVTEHNILADYGKTRRKLDNRASARYADTVFADSWFAGNRPDVDADKRRAAFDAIYAQAYEDAHSDSFAAVRDRYNELEDMFLTAMRWLA